MGVACCSAGGTAVVHKHDVDWRKRRTIAFKKNLLSHVVSGNGESNSVSDGYIFFAPPTRWHFLAALHRQQRTHDLAAQAQRRRQQRITSPDNSRRPADIVSTTSKGSGKVVAFADDSKSAVHDFSPSIDTAVEMPTDVWCYLVHTSQYLPIIVDPNAPGSSVTVDHGHLRADGTVDASKMRRRSSRRFSKRKSQQGSVNSRNPLGADSAASILVNSNTTAAASEASASSHPAYKQGEEEEFSDDGGGSTCDSNTMMVRGAGGGGEYLYLADAKLATTAKKKNASQARLLSYFDGKPLIQNTLTERHHQHINASSDDAGGDGLGLFAFNGGRFSELAAANQALIRSVSNTLWMAAPLHKIVPNTSSDLLLPTTSSSHPDEEKDSTRVVSKGPSTMEKQEKALLTCMSPLDLFLIHPSSYFDSAHYEAAVSGRGLAHGPSRVAVGEVPAVALHINSFAVECQQHHQNTVTAAAQSHHEAPKTRRSAMAKRERCGAAARSLLQRALGASLSTEEGVGGEPSGTKDLALSCFTKAATRRHQMKSFPLPPPSNVVGQQSHGASSMSGQPPPSAAGMKSLVTELASTKVDHTTTFVPQPPAVLFASAGLASTPRHPLAPALTALTTTSILPTNIPSLEGMDTWISSISTTTKPPLSHRTNLFTSPSRHSHPSPTTFLSEPAVMDLSNAVQQLWRGAIGTGRDPSGSDSQYERGTESTRQQSFAATTPLSGSTFNAEDMHVPDEDGPPLSLPNNKGPRIQRIHSDSTTVPQHPPQHTPLRTIIQSKGTLSLSLGVSTTYVRLGCRHRGGGSSTPSAAYEGEGGGGGWGTPRRQSQHSTTSPDESQWGTPRGGRRRRSLIPRPSTTIMISSPAQEDGGGGGVGSVEEAHVSPPIFMAAPPSPSPPPPAAVPSSSSYEDQPTNGIEGVSLLLQTLTM